LEKRMKKLIYRLFALLCLIILPVSLLASPAVELRYLRTLKAPCHVTTQPAWHPNGRELAVGCNLHRAVTIWDAQTGKVLRNLDKEKGSVWVLAYSPDGKYLAVGRAFIGADDLNIYDAASGQLLRSFSPPPAEGAGRKSGSPEALAFSPDSRYLAAGGSSTPISVLDVETGKRNSTLFNWGMRPNEEKKGINSVLSVAYSPDGRWIAVGYVDGRLELWETGSWSVVRKLSARDRGVSGLTFSPDNKHLVVRLASPVIFLKKPDNDKKYFDGEFLPNDSDIFILVAPSFSLSRHFKVNGTAHAPLSYASDGRMLFSSGVIAAKVIDVSTGEILREIKFTPTVHFPAISKDGKYLAVGSGQEVRLYKLIR
jgi:WD40 repeat protein